MALFHCSSLKTPTLPYGSLYLSCHW
uniref:Uncharacterized protein n=1 Tax=Rhizophora mucronata TaxID=61149 RepID=A0A2P2L6M4_RHIMU